MKDGAGASGRNLAALIALPLVAGAAAVAAALPQWASSEGPHTACQEVRQAAERAALVVGPLGHTRRALPPEVDDTALAAACRRAT